MANLYCQIVWGRLKQARWIILMDCGGDSFNAKVASTVYLVQYMHETKSSKIATKAEKTM